MAQAQPRCPQKLGHDALRSWATIPMALAVGLDIGRITHEDSFGIIPSRHLTKASGSQKQRGSGSYQETRKLEANEVYIGHGHHSHRQKASKWASPFIVGQHGTVEDCLIKYTDYIAGSQLAEEMEELIGKRLLSDTPDSMPCTADVLIAMVYYSWRNNSLVIPQEYTKPKKKAHLYPNKWSRRALGLMAATTGDAWRAIHGEWGSMARHPPLPLAQYHRWQQQSLTDTFASHFPDEVFDISAFHTSRT